MQSERVGSFSLRMQREEFWIACTLGGDKMGNQKTLDKIDMVYEKAREMRLNFNQDNPDKNLADRTYNTYRDVVKAYANHLHKEYGIEDIAKAKPRHAYDYVNKQIEDYKTGKNASVYSIKRFAHAIESFRQASAETGVFRRACAIGDKRQILDQLKSEGMVRSSVDSKSLKANHSDYQKVDAQIQNSQSPHKGTIQKLHQVQRFIGCRSIEACRMKVKDINFKDSVVRIKGKGGLVRYVQVKDKGTMDMLKAQSAGKRGGAPVFQIRGRDGNEKGANEMAKLLKKEVRNAAVRAGVDRDGKKYTSHSGRKAFAQANMDGYKKKSVRQLRQEIGNRIKADKVLKKKYDRTLKNVRSKIKDPDKRKERELTHKELCTLLTSFDLGHGRLDVVRFYASY
jgi:integrase